MANSDRRYEYRLEEANERARVPAPSLGRMTVADLRRVYLANVLSLRQAAEGG